MICVRWILVVGAAKNRKPGYLDHVRRTGRKKDDLVCFTPEEYAVIQDRFAMPIVIPKQPLGSPPPAAAIKPVRPPSFRGMIQSAGKEAVKWAKAGFLLASKDALERRERICKDCRRWDKDAFLGAGGCRLCGCSKLKLYLATTACPDKPPRWPAEV